VSEAWSWERLRSNRGFPVAPRTTHESTRSERKKGRKEEIEYEFDLEDEYD
jgi:hypothetical protein